MYYGKRSNTFMNQRRQSRTIGMVREREQNSSFSRSELDGRVVNRVFARRASSARNYEQA